MPFSLGELEPGGFKGEALFFSLNIPCLECSLLLTDCRVRASNGHLQEMLQAIPTCGQSIVGPHRPPSLPKFVVVVVVIFTVYFVLVYFFIIFLFFTRPVLALTQHRGLHPGGL